MKDHLTDIAEVLKRRGALSAGEDAEALAREWAAAGFGDAPEVEDWLEAGCATPACARLLDDAGLTPEQAAIRTGGGSAGYEETVGRKVANGDLSLEEARRVVTSEFWND